jgi:homocysteine S-methyltransferase
MLSQGSVFSLPKVLKRTNYISQNRKFFNNLTSCFKIMRGCYNLYVDKTVSNKLLARLAEGDVIILDGALGTELERMRAISVSPIWSAEVIDTHEELLENIHKDYVDAGADIITAGTFRSTHRAFSKVGRQDEFERVTHKAVDIARKAIKESNTKKQVYIAGSIAPLEDCYSPNLVPSDEDCLKEHENQARVLAEAGVDLLLCETFNSIREGLTVLRGAQKQKLPVFLSFTCTPSGDLLSGESFTDLVQSFGDLYPDCLMVNCTPTHTLHIALKSLLIAWEGPVGAYGNVGQSEIQHWDFSGDISASSYLEFAKKWVSLGAQVIGGCCGTNPDYIRHLAYHLPDRVPPGR